MIKKLLVITGCFIVMNNAMAVVEPKIDVKNITTLEGLSNAIALMYNYSRSLLNTVENQPASLWKPKLGLFEFDKKKKLEALQNTMSFEKYQTFIKDLKFFIERRKAELDNILKIKKNTLDKPANWFSNLKSEVLQDINVLIQNVKAPVNVIEKQITELKKLKPT